MKCLLVLMSFLLAAPISVFAGEGIILDFSDCTFTDEEGSPRSRSISNKVQNILTDEHAEDVERISFSTNTIGDKSIPSLCSLANLPRLKVLDLSYTVITEEGVPELLPLLRSPHVQFVDITETNATLFDAIEKFLRGIRSKVASEEEHLALSKKLIFINQSWFNYGKARAILDPLVEQRLLPHNWLDLHRTYYTQYKND